MRKISIAIASLFLLASSVVIYSCNSGTAAAGTVLKFNLEKGKAYDYKIDWDLDQQMMGTSNKIKVIANYSMAVTGEEAGNKILTGTYESFKMNIKMAGMEIDVDTDKPNPPLTEDEMKANPLGMISRMFAGIKGKSFTMSVDPEGKVISVSGFESIVRSMVDSMQIPEEAKMQVEVSLKDQFNDDMIRDQFAQAFTIFPNKAVKVGDTWQKTFAVKGKTPSNYVTDYTVKQIDGGTVTLDARTTIASADSTVMKLNGLQTGKLLVDSKTGLVVDASFDQDIKINMNQTDVEMKGKGTIKGKAK